MHDETLDVFRPRGFMAVGVNFEWIDQPRDVRRYRLSILLRLEYLAKNLQAFIGRKRRFLLPVAKNLDMANGQFGKRDISKWPIVFLAQRLLLHRFHDVPAPGSRRLVQ